jgi:hypothetical protein
MRERTSRACEVSGECRPLCAPVGIREVEMGLGHVRPLDYVSVVFEGTRVNMLYMGTIAGP